MRRYRVREIGPSQFTAERKGWLFWCSLNSEGHERDGSVAWGMFGSMWATAEAAEAACLRAEDNRRFPRTVKAMEYE